MLHCVSSVNDLYYILCVENYVELIQMNQCIYGKIPLPPPAPFIGICPLWFEKKHFAPPNGHFWKNLCPPYI